MIPLLILGVALAAIILGYLWMVRRDRPEFIVRAEYWVYIPGNKMPDHDAMLVRLVRDNPYKQQGANPIGPPEGLILSDIRFHMGLVLRSKNAHVFRPDLFEDVEVTAEQIAALDDSNAIVKLRYLSEKPLKDKRHLQFLIHASDAVADLAEGLVVYDVSQGRMWSRDDLRRALAEDLDATRCEMHVRTIWRDLAAECIAETRGLKKLGVPELRTVPMESDEQVLVTQVLQDAVDRVWTQNHLGEEVEVEEYGDTFKIQFEVGDEEFATVRILRVQSL
jgi:hypothetical protein